MLTRILGGVAVALLCAAAPASSQQPGSLPCDEGGAAPFLSAASDIRSACEYLFESRPANFTLAASNLHLAIAKEPANADARLLLAVVLAASGSRAEAREALAAAERVDSGARRRLAAFLAANPELRAPVEAALAAPAPAGPQRPGSAPAPAAPAPASRTFRVGDRVEVEYRAGFWVPGVVTSVDAGACPYYRVRHDPYGDGVQRELGYFCKTTRAPSGAAQPRRECGGSNGNCPPAGPPPPGAYVCTEQIWQGPGPNPQYRSQPRPTITLLPGNRYRLYRDGAVGSYRYDPATYRIHWIGGGMAAQGGQASYGLDGRTPEITIAFGAGGSGRSWQCGLGR